MVGMGWGSLPGGAFREPEKKKTPHPFRGGAPLGELLIGDAGARGYRGSVTSSLRPFSKKGGWPMQKHDWLRPLKRGGLKVILSALLRIAEWLVDWVF